MKVFSLFFLVGLCMRPEQEVIHYFPTPLFPIEYLVTPDNIFLSAATITHLVYDSTNRIKVLRVKEDLIQNNCERLRETDYFAIDCVYGLIENENKHVVGKFDKKLKSYGAILTSYLDRIKEDYTFPDAVANEEIGWKEKARAVAKYIKSVFGGKSISNTNIKLVFFPLYELFKTIFVLFL